MRTDKELKSLEWVKEILAAAGLTAVETTDPYAHHDLECSNGGIIEVKQRYLTTYEFIKYSQQGFILEDIKYNHLLGKKSLYVNVFNFGKAKVMLIWNVNNLESNVESMHCKATTEFANNNYKPKPVRLINIKQCQTMFINTNGSWITCDEETILKTI